jgi:hypothetical protein
VSQHGHRISHNDVVTAAGGKRAGSRRGAKPKAQFQPISLVLALAITLAIIAWGYLVYLAILHGQDMRAGDSTAWRMAAATGVGAVACLFAGFLLLARLLRVLGVTRPPETAPTIAPTPGGGRRIRSDS